MKNLFFLFLSILMLVGVSCTTDNPSISTETIEAKAPFDMPAIQIPDFSNAKKFIITDFGAKPGEKEATTTAIAEAIAKANKSGGGRVVIPEGNWLTGKIHLRSNVNLHLDKGAVLNFSPNPKDYLPAVHTTWEGMECFNYSPLIYAFKCKNVAITGEGELNAKMNVWRTWFSRPPAHMNSLKRLYDMASEGLPVEERNMVNDTSNLRPHFIQFNRCENVLLEGVSISDSPFWVIHPYHSKNVVIRKVNVWAHGHNNDGVDPEMSQNILIEDCVFDQGDDAIAVKSGRNQDAWRLDMPSRNIVVRNCVVKKGHQLLAIGSELSGGVENIFMDSCIVEDGADLFHLVFIKTNERRGGYVKNIHVQNIEAGKMREGVLGIETDVLYQWRDLVPTYERRLTPISDIHLKNIHAGDVKFISRIQGQAEQPVKNVILSNITVDNISEEELKNENVKGFKIE